MNSHVNLLSRRFLNLRLALEKLDVDGDWDPDAYDKQMADIYGMDDDGIVDEEKPQWDDDIDITDIVPDGAGELDKKKKNKKRKKAKEVDEGDDGVDVDEMDADVERVEDDEEWDGTEEMRKRKLDEYMDEVYGLEFNDMVSFSRRLPTRLLTPCRCRLGACPRASSTQKRLLKRSASPPWRSSWRPTRS